MVEIDTGWHAPDPEIISLIKKNEKPFNTDVYKIVGYSSIPLYRYFVAENPIHTLVLDALKWKIQEVAIVLSNGFGFCPPRTTPDNTGNIPITEGFLFDMLPINSKIRIGKVTGKQIKDWLKKELNNLFAKDTSERLGGWLIKFRGMKISFNAFGEKEKRVRRFMLQMRHFSG